MTMNICLYFKCYFKKTFADNEWTFCVSVNRNSVCFDFSLHQWTKKTLKISRYGTVTVLVYNVYYMAQTYCSSLKESILCNVCLLDGLLSWDVRHCRNYITFPWYIYNWKLWKKWQNTTNPVHLYWYYWHNILVLLT